MRTVLPYFLEAFAFIGLVPEGVPRAAELMNIGGDGLSLLRYAACDELTSSDHRPVLAEFALAYEPLAGYEPRPAPAVAAKAGDTTSAICAVM